jgi:hypothetical protein
MIGSDRAECLPNTRVEVLRTITQWATDPNEPRNVFFGYTDLREQGRALFRHLLPTFTENYTVSARSFSLIAISNNKVIRGTSSPPWRINSANSIIGSDAPLRHLSKTHQALGNPLFVFKSPGSSSSHFPRLNWCRNLSPKDPFWWYWMR